MSFSSPLLPQIPRQSVVGMEGMWAKMFDPPTESPPTPELLAPTNPVPEVMLAAGLQSKVTTPHTLERDLMHGMKIQTWDNRPGDLMFFLFNDPDNPTTGGGTFPAPTTRVPRGAIFHGHTKGAGPPPHTFHWHGIEPTPIHDGVGHCSMEIGEYVYQWQPNFIGSYFYHCHRNTVQHFEFGLYGFLPIDPPDAFFASCATDPQVATQANPVTLNATPIGNGRPEPGFPNGRRRTAANLEKFPQFPGWNSNPITAPDPEANNPALPAWLKFAVDPHAMTVPYDVEVIWVFDDRDSRWSDLAPNARATFPFFGSVPGANDNFHGNFSAVPVAPTDFFAFNDFRADYWFVTGVPVPAARVDLGGTGVGTINPAALPPLGGIGGIAVADGLIPPQLNSGVSGTQIAVNAQVGQTIFLRALSASYNTAIITLPVDAVIISADGRALGVPPFGQYNHAFLLPAGTPIRLSVARRGDALIRATSPINSFAKIEFIDTRSGETRPGPVLMTALIPFNIGTPAGVRTISGTVVNSQNGQPISGVQMNLTGPANQMVLTDALGNYTFTGLANGVYTVIASQAGFRFSPPERSVTIDGANQAGHFFRGRRL